MTSLADRSPHSARRIKVLLVFLAFPPKQDAEMLQEADLGKYISALAQISLLVVTSPPPGLSALYNSFTRLPVRNTEI